MRDVAALAEALVGYIRTHRREEVAALVASPEQLHAFAKATLGVDDHDARVVLLDLAETMIEIDLRDPPTETSSGSSVGGTLPATTRTRPGG